MNHLQLAEIAVQAYAHLQYEESNIEFTHSDHVFAFRGTDEVADAFRDLRILPWWTKGLGWCPSGFVKASDDVLIRVLAIAMEYNLKPSQIILTGHSLGGAIALIVGAKLALLGYPVKEIVTFGAPRCGRLKVLDVVPVTMYRNGRDVVTQMPPLMRRHNDNVSIGTPGDRLADHRMKHYLTSLRR